MRHIIIVLSLFFCTLTHAVEQLTTADEIAAFPHDGVVNAVAFSPDGQYVLTGSDDDTAVLWTLDGKEQQTFPHKRDVNAVAFSPDGKYVLTGSDDGTAVLWTLDGHKERTFSNGLLHYVDGVNAVAFSPDGKYVLTGSYDGTAVRWTLDGDKKQTFSKGLLHHVNDVKAVTFSPDGKYVLTGSNDNTAVLWTLEGKKVQTFSNGLLHDVNAVAFSPDGKYVLTGSDDNTAVQWTLDGDKEQTFSHDSDVNAVAFSPDGKYVLTGSDDKTAILWTRSGQKIQTFSYDKKVNAVAFSPDGKLVLIGSGDKAHLYAITLFHFSTIPTAQSSHLTVDEVAVMMRLGVKIRYDGEEKLHTLQADDLPEKVVQAVELNLSNLLLDELPPWLGKFHQLRYLNLSRNQLKLSTLATLFNLPQLENLDLSGNPVFKMTIGDGGLFAHLPNLLILNLRYTELNDADWANLTLPKLLNLDISSNRLTQLNLSNQPRLRKVNASNNQIATLQLHDLDALEELNLNHNQLTTLNLNLLPDSLNILRAENNQLLRIEFDRKQDRPQLEALYLTGNKALKLPESMGATFVLPNLRVCHIDSSVVVPEGLRRKLESYK